MKAVKRFDPRKGVRLVCRTLIRAECTNLVSKLVSLKLPPQKPKEAVF